MDSNMRAIVYTTNAGSTEQYAKLLAQETGLPVYSLAEAKRTLSSGTEIVYLGWIMASTVKGYADAAKLMTEVKRQVRSDIDFEMRQKYNDQVKIERERIAAIRAIGVAYGKGQQPTTTNLMFLR